MSDLADDLVSVSTDELGGVELDLEHFSHVDLARGNGFGDATDRRTVVGVEGEADGNARTRAELLVDERSAHGCSTVAEAPQLEVVDLHIQSVERLDGGLCRGLVLGRPLLRRILKAALDDIYQGNQ